MPFKKLVLATALLALAATTAFAQTPGVRVRGTVERLEGGVATVKTAEGQSVTLKLAPNVSISAVVKISAAEIKPGAQVLDVAGGAGYSAAIMAALGAEVTLVEEEAEQAEAAKRILAQAHIKGVTVAVGPLASGGKKSAKYDAILVNGRCETVPELLLKKLSDGGRLVVISGNAVSSNVRVFTCTEGAIGEKRLMSAAGPALSAFSRVPEFVF